MGLEAATPVCEAVMQSILSSRGVEGAEIFMICTDFNAHSLTWGAINNDNFLTNSRGNIIDEILSFFDDIILLKISGTLAYLNSISGALSAKYVTLRSSQLSLK